ncbi:hypothetical protein DYB28_004676 [Aphanomyces astaci]|uniref:Kinesin motor domain-containing protein n=2 Tax=Aphanomyces astaci TaxID=112090 RepID=A0A9X8HE00_APHAT|nr:hypothetical protein DYB28_004676 [Aphanomyces astaci]
MANGEVECSKAKEAQDNLTLRQEVKTLTMRLQDAEKSTAADDVQVILALSMQHADKLNQLQSEHDKRKIAWVESENALRAQVRALEADKLARTASYECVVTTSQLNLWHHVTDPDSFVGSVFSRLTDITMQLEAASHEAAQCRSRVNQLETADAAHLERISMQGLVCAAVAEKDQLAQLYAAETKARRHLHNKVMEMGGNIRVFCRVRPTSDVERASAESSEVVTFRREDPQVLELTLAEGPKHTFEFDYVFQALEVRMSKQGAFVDNLMEVEVHSTADVADLMALGHSHRSVGAHDVNEHSSRSHLVLSITITTPVQWNASESLCSLNFAQRCRNVALGQLKSPPPSTSTTLPPSASVPKPATKAPKQSGALSATDKVRVTCSTGPKSPRKDMT